MDLKIWHRFIVIKNSDHADETAIETIYGRFAPCLDVSPPKRFAPWTIRLMHVDVSPPELSVLGVSPSRCGRTDGRFDVKPLGLVSEVKSLALASVIKSLAPEAKGKNTYSEASKGNVRGLTS